MQARPSPSVPPMSPRVRLSASCICTLAKSVGRSSGQLLRQWGMPATSKERSTWSNSGQLGRICRHSRQKITETEAHDTPLESENGTFSTPGGDSNRRNAGRPAYARFSVEQFGPELSH
jgi:hypothetical protein